MATVDALPFLFMGCWNRVGPARDTVAHAICENPITNFVLGGDNIYPTKTVDLATGAKSKKYDMSVFDTGIAALNCKSILGTALGNHNIYNPDVLKAQMKRLTPGGGSRYYTLKYNDVNLIFLDSNLMEPEKASTDMLHWFANELDTTVGHDYFLIQHEPLVAFKKRKIHQLKNNTALLDVLVRRPPIAILCADTHHFQHGIIEYKGVRITQYVVGTGGAEPDFMEATTDTISTDAIKYTRLDYKKGYGYLQVNSLSDIDFVKVIDWEGVSGGRRKTLKHKRRPKPTLTRKSRQ